MPQNQTYLLLSLATIFWGIQPLCIKILIASWTPASLTCLLYLLISLILFLIMYLRHEKKFIPPKNCIIPLLLMGLTGIAINNVSQFTGLKYSTITNCTLIAATGPAVTAMLSAVFIPTAFIPGLIGVDYRSDEIVGALETIGCEVIEADGGWEVIPPSWRPDLTDRWTLAEEVARLHGLDRIPSILPTPPSGRGLTALQRGRRRVVNALAAAGHVEVVAFPFTTEEQNALHGSPSGERLPSIRLANPLDGQAPFLRRSLLPGLLQIAHRNGSRGFTDLALFETGTVFTPAPGAEYGTTTVPPLAQLPDEATLAALHASIPPQPRHVAVLLHGHAVSKAPGQQAISFDLADALGAVQTVATAAGVTIDVRQAQRAALHPGRAGSLFVGDAEVGYVGELLPTVAEAADLHGRVFVAEIDLDSVLALTPAPDAAPSLATYPAATQDVSLVVPADLAASEVSGALAHGAGALLEDLRLVDDYRGAGVPDGSKSLTFALRFRADDRTLTAAEATEAKLAGVAVAAERYGAAIRD